MQIDRPITIAIIIFIIILLIFFLVMPEYNQFKILQQQLGEKIAERNVKFDYYNAIAAAYDAIQNRSEVIKKIDDALPTESNIGKLIYFFHKKAGEDGIVIKSLSLRGGDIPVPGQNFKELGFSLSVLGSYASLNDFIKSLEKSSRIFEVTSISFSSGNSGAPISQPIGSAVNKTQFQIEDIYSFNIEVKTYSY